MRFPKEASVKQGSSRNSQTNTDKMWKYFFHIFPNWCELNRHYLIDTAESLKGGSSLTLQAQEFGNDLVWPVASGCGNEHNELVSRKSHALSHRLPDCADDSRPSSPIEDLRIHHIKIIGTDHGHVLCACMPLAIRIDQHAGDYANKVVVDLVRYLYQQACRAGIRHDSSRSASRSRQLRDA